MRRLCPPEERRLRSLLASASRASAQTRYLHRLHAVLLVSIGRSCYEVARWFGDDPRSVERWVHAFETAGDAGLHDHHAGGRKSQLTAAQAEALAHDLTQAPSALGYHHARWSAKLIALHVQARFDIRLSARQCLRMYRGNPSPAARSAQGRAGAATSDQAASRGHAKSG